MHSSQRVLLLGMCALLGASCASQPAPRATHEGKKLKLETIYRAWGPPVYLYREV